VFIAITLFKFLGPTKSSSVSKENALAIADKIVEAGIQTIVISGGEPTTQPDIVLEVGEHLKKHGKKVSVITNGTLITDELACELARLDIEVFVSLTAPFELLHDETVGKKGAYKKTIHGIHLLVEKGVRTGINMVVTQKNKTMIQEMGSLAVSLGVGAFSASRMIPPWGIYSDEIRSLLLDRSDVRRMFQDLRIVRQSTNLLIYTQSCYPLCLMADFSAPIHLKYCSIGGPALAIGPKGEIRPCALMPQVCGNVLVEGFGPALERMISWRVEALAPPECQTCQVFEQCKGGCRITAHYNGNVSGLDMHADPQAIAVALGLE